MLEKRDYIHVGTDEAFENYKKESVIDADIENVYNTIEYCMKKPDLLGKTLLVSERQFSKVNGLVSELCDFMDMSKPEVYVFEDFFYGIESYGMHDYWIEISAKTIRDFTDSELRFLFARELYKIKAGVVYQTMLKNQVFGLQASIPAIGELLKETSRFKFNHWCRLENYTADNFGYLMCNDLTASINAIVAMVLNSKTMLSEIDMMAFIKQASAINKMDDVVSNYTKSDETMPYAPYRVECLLAYAVSKRGIKARKEIERCLNC